MTTEISVMYGGEKVKWYNLAGKFDCILIAVMIMMTNVHFTK